MYTCTHTWTYAYTYKTKGGFMTQFYHGGLAQVALCGLLVLAVNQGTGGSSGVPFYLSDTE